MLFGKRNRVVKRILIVEDEPLTAFDNETMLTDAGYEVVATGLDMDFRGEPFGPMPRLLAGADEVVKLRAICARCGRDASRSQRLINGRPAPVSAPTILVGAEESYEARCRHCHEVPEGVFQYGLPGL